MLPENILFSQDPNADLAQFLRRKKYSNVVVLVDENTRKNCFPEIREALPDLKIIEVKSGEEQKNIATCSLIWEEMTTMALDRHALLIVLGGGVLGDMGGFCAATYKRGIDFILIPTTLLAQVDASIGGKLGVDFNNYKNHIGVFQQPALTLLFSGFLKTLPVSELRSGFAEVIKHCLISDAAMWTEISSRKLNEQRWEILAKHSVEFKARVTTEDPKEKGLRKILNAGHTIGHAVESYLLSKGHRILHGEAIAIGLIAECFIANQRNFLSEKELQAIKTFIVQVFGKVCLTESDIRESAKFALQDKKNKGNQILCVLLDGIGKARWDEEISINEIKSALDYYQSV
ncbi:MAG TPA: 3-dehydroquinate synthase [Ohtaekwangia sp.]|nr:3-dehydroquinate synthase [Ohtaekwangia sp.]